MSAPQLVRVERTVEIEQQRSTLPAVMSEQEIVDAVRSNDFSIVCGDTGCGKSTQVPQFLYEAGFTEGPNAGMLIGVTQPRRVAAIAVADRVGVELNAPKLVGYQVRYEKRIASAEMRVKFMTDGILLREIQEDIRLPRYSVIVIDEAHERSINCDMLLGLLSGSVRARKSSKIPLKVVVMSATLRMTDFTQNKFLGTPAVVQIDNRMHAVVVHYERKTADAYVDVAVERIQTIHKTLPPGSILVFVTGKAEVHTVCAALAGLDDGGSDGAGSDDDMEEAVGGGGREGRWAGRSVVEAVVDGGIVGEGDFNLGQTDGVVETLTFKRDGAVVEESQVVSSDKKKRQKTTKQEKPKAVVTAGERDDAESTVTSMFIGGGAGSKLQVMPLYAQMPSERQMEVFRAAALFPNDRVVVVATNVAETSLTIPNVRYVVDCGKEKRKEYNASGVSRFAIRFTSQASANQRAGRAGRVGPGHVYRLYSANVFGEHMAEHALAEIETNPLDSAVLFLQSMGVPSVSHFPWPSPPPAAHVTAAVRRLRAIGALQEVITNGRSVDKVTELGKRLNAFPIAPRLAVALVSAIDACIRGDQPIESLAMVVAVVSMLSVEFLGPVEKEGESAKTREIALHEFSDDLELAVTVLAKWSGARFAEREALMEKYGILQKGMDEARSLFAQLWRDVRKTTLGGDVEDADALLSKSVKGDCRGKFRFVRECCTRAFVDQIAVKEEAGSRVYQAPNCSEGVYIHRSSAVFRLRPSLIAYGEVQQASGEFGNHNRSVRMCFAVDRDFLASIDSPLIDKSKMHPFMKPTVVAGRKIAFVIPKYVPLGITICDCFKVDVPA